MKKCLYKHRHNLGRQRFADQMTACELFGKATEAISKECKMKKIMSISLALAMLLCLVPTDITVSAASSGYYTYTVWKGGATITDCNPAISGDVTIPSTLGGYPVTSIGSQAFYGCNKLTRVTMPSSLTSIGPSAFESCTSLTNIYLPNSAISISAYAFADTAYYNNSANWEKDILYLGAHCIDAKKSISGSRTIKSGTKTIAEYAFSDCLNLNYITIPNSVVLIPEYAFFNCPSLLSVTMPISVTEIGRNAFYNSRISNVYYAGTSTQKQKISIDDDGNESLTKAQWHYEICTGTTKHLYDSICDTICNECNYERDYSHEFEWIIDKQATCVDNGIRHQECSVCYTKQNENSVIDPTNKHTYDDVCDGDCNVCRATRDAPHSFKWIVDESATCGHTGVMHLECSLCHIKRSENTLIEATGNHTYDDVCDNECNVCRKARNAPHNYKWVVDTQEKCVENGIKHEECTFCHIKRNENTIIEAPGVHVFDTVCDTDCNECGFIRQVPEHTYDTDYTCDICKYSKKPDMPCIDIVSTNSVKLQSAVGCEYSKDGINWQTSPEFLGLDPDTQYTFYQRVKASDNALVSETSVGITAITKKAFYIRYDANGGVGAPDMQMKTEGVPINVSAQTPTRTGYEFMGWGTTEKCGSPLSPNEEYSVDKDVTLFALWCASEKCEACKGTGDQTCPYCGGDGRLENHRVCINCGSRNVTEELMSGMGFVYLCDICGTWWTDDLDCSSCDRGRMDSDCYNCNGNGTALISELMLPAPTILSFSDTTVSVLAMSGYEYSKDGRDWQASNIFTNLSPGTKYTFYLRLAPTETEPFSPKGIGATITTDRAKQTLIPAAPTVQNSTANSITLSVVDGCEYSIDGIKWQSSNVFNDLSCGTEYTFYQRYKETTTTYVGQSSAPLTAKTDKGTQSAPFAPTLVKKTHNSVTLTEISGYEYSRDGVNWQKSNVFTGLNPETNYMFYQRKAETDKYYVGPSSNPLTVKTLEEPQYIPGDLDGVDGVTDRDAVHLLYHTFLPNLYPVNQDCDFNGDGYVNDKDAVYLLYHTFLPHLYPLS